MIRNIVFDIGNVLTDFRWREFLQDKGFEDDMMDRIAKASVASPLWNGQGRVGHGETDGRIRKTGSRNRIGAAPSL